MRILTPITLGLGIGLSCLTYAASAQTLFTYGDNKVNKSDFLKVYQKNNVQKKPDYSAKSVNEYLNLYSLFRMKVKEAEEMQLDTTSAVINELNNYKAQLARTYLSDKNVTNELIKQAYERMKEEVKVAHILITLKPNEDTAAAYQKIDSLYHAVTKKKADFAELASKYSEDKGSAVQGGELGYISALQVVYPFESAAYNTPKGQVSKPFRTQFGYHIVKVEDRRPNRGQLKVAQIMVATQKSRGEEGINEAKEKIKDIQEQLKSGASFEELAKKNSDDRYSRDKGGVLEPFGVGKMTPVFEQAAFALKKAGDVSEPVQTEYGFHLIKLIEKLPLQPFDSIRDQVTRRVENDSRATVAKDAYQQKIKKEYGFKEYSEPFTQLIAALPSDSLLRTTGFSPEDFQSYNATLFEVGGQKYSQSDFMNYAYDITKGKLMGNKEATVRDLYGMYQNMKINDLQQDALEKNNVEFKSLITEYRDGILLFDLMDKNVWSKASKDTVGLAEFYALNQARYQWQAGFEGIVFQSPDESELIALHQAMAQHQNNVEEAVEEVRKSGKASGLSQQNGRYEFNRFPIDKTEFTEGKTTSIFKNAENNYSFVLPQKLHTLPQPKNLDEARGFVIADYQDYLEKKWNQELKEKYPVIVDQKVMSSIIKK